MEEKYIYRYCCDTCGNYLRFNKFEGVCKSQNMICESHSRCDDKKNLTGLGYCYCPAENVPVADDEVRSLYMNWPKAEDDFDAFWLITEMAVDKTTFLTNVERIASMTAQHLILIAFNILYDSNPDRLIYWISEINSQYIKLIHKKQCKALSTPEKRLNAISHRLIDEFEIDSYSCFSGEVWSAERKENKEACYRRGKGIKEVDIHIEPTEELYEAYKILLDSCMRHMSDFTYFDEDEIRTLLSHLKNK